MGISGGGIIKSSSMLNSLFENKGRVSTGVSKVSVKKSGGKSEDKKPKKLWYNFKELSSLILRSKTSGGARRAVTLARGRVAQLRGKLGTGIYDSEELESAILHAEAMVRVAKKRVKHFNQEEAAARDGVMPDDECYGEPDEEEKIGETVTDGGDPAEMSNEELEKLMREMERLMRESMDDIEEAMDMEEFSEELMADSGEMSSEELDYVRKKHRADELREITEADMKYLKAMFDRLQRAKQSASSSASSGGSSNGVSAGAGYAASDGVALELGGADMPVGTVSEAAAMTAGAAVDVTV
ncbi:MAG: hypothetical protein NC223_00050 [Butyrivibrio sp.]|nr:hypothetical protein [Butyrivibrio sp.]